MIITKEKCKQIIEYNTTGRGKSNPNFTSLANAKIWLANIEWWEEEEQFLDVKWSLPEHSKFLNKGLYQRNSL